MKNLASDENNYGDIHEKAIFTKFGTNAEIDIVLHMLIHKCQHWGILSPVVKLDANYVHFPLVDAPEVHHRKSESRCLTGQSH